MVISYYLYQATFWIDLTIAYMFLELNHFLLYRYYTVEYHLAIAFLADNVFNEDHT